MSAVPRAVVRRTHIRRTRVLRTRVLQTSVLWAWALRMLVLAAAIPAASPGAYAAGLRDRSIPEIPSANLSVVSPQPFTIGDSFDISLTIYHHRGEEIHYPENEALFQPFVLKQVRVRQRRAGRGTVKTLVLYTVSAYRTGNLTLGPLPVTIHGKAGETGTVTVPILSVLPRDEENPQPKPIVGPYRPRIRPVTILIIFGSLAAAFGLYLLLSRLLKRKRRVKIVHEHREKPLDPYHHTLKELQELQQRYRREFMDDKEVYLRISHLLRLYFGHIWAVRALEMTTSQIKQYMGRSGSRSGPDGAFLEVLNRSDMVKFARQKINHQVISGDIECAIDLVKKAHETARQEERQAPGQQEKVPVGSEINTGGG